MNMLLTEDIDILRVTRASGDLRPGDVTVSTSVANDVVARIASETGVDFQALEVDPSGVSRPLERLRIGMYQRYRGGNIDEGWTRLLLERFKFPYTTLHGADIKDGDLADDFDVIILPADSKNAMIGQAEQEDTPPEWRSGFGQEGVDALEAFVVGGGTLVTFANAGDLAIDEFDLPVRNVVADVPSREFWSPGSTLHITVDNENPLGYGMPKQALALFLLGNQAYQVVPSDRNHRVERIATFIDRDILQGGWLLGEERIANKAAVISVGHEKGLVVLIGFRAQHRVQTHGTFKFLFNALVGGGYLQGEVAAGGSQ
jgi:hypothetical protein